MTVKEDECSPTGWNNTCIFKKWLLEIFYWCQHWTHPLSNDNQTIREIHDILKSYYKLSCKRFVDNVRMQAADYCLVTGPNTPLSLFSPKLVTDLNSSQLEAIAGEEPSTKRRRVMLEKETELLEEGIRILR
ncbi:hypothetical protein S40285_09679 [Stachybotrys chlorohalonatus IBT 40285]|uniref:GED domain-containing protein n=1 Tax=Stachybotrys chlorohalonatus (strain IBT 40285) TaxID=1283841 RepID=A0A084QP89_STAC4|nr:hypothetical protein S40285_09679 [Stachybotrys chlorohalonata IBT 40285]